MVPLDWQNNGGPSLCESGKRVSLQRHIPQPPWEGRLEGPGKEVVSNSQTWESGGAVRGWKHFGGAIFKSEFTPGETKTNGRWKDVNGKS